MGNPSREPLVPAQTAASSGVPITGQVWRDRNADGIRQTDEPPLSGITVDISSITSVATPITNADGTFSAVVPPGTYIVCFLVPGPANLSFNKITVNGTTFAPAGNCSNVFNAAAGTPITVDAAFRDPTLAVTGTPAVEMALFALTMIGVGSALCRRTRANAPRELSRRQR